MYISRRGHIQYRRRDICTHTHTLRLDNTAELNGVVVAVVEDYIIYFEIE